MTDINDQQTPLEKPLGIGEQLIQAREAKNISIAEVSSQLRLVKENIQALESGLWGDLHGRAYARGYLISYVKFLGLPEEEFLTAFNREYEPSASEVALPNNHVGMFEKKGFPWFKLLFFIVLLVIGWFTYQQWLQFEAESAVEVMPTTDTVEPVTDMNSFSRIVEPIISEQVLSSPAVAVELEEIQAVVKVASNEVSEAETDSIVANQQAVEAIVQQETIIEAKLDLQTSIETVIELGFSDDCWINITDFNGQTLINKVMFANSSIELKGQAPLSVSLGRASAVSMKVNDEIFDFTPHVRGDVAKFTLGAKS